jgi:hypothetical protein
VGLSLALGITFVLSREARQRDSSGRAGGGPWHEHERTSQRLCSATIDSALCFLLLALCCCSGPSRLGTVSRT